MEIIKIPSLTLIETKRGCEPACGAGLRPLSKNQQCDTTKSDAYRVEAMRSRIIFAS